VAALARALERSVGQQVGQDVWSRDRLPHLVDSWYRYATDVSNAGRAPN